MIPPQQVRRAVVGDVDQILAVQQACSEAPQWNRTHYSDLFAQGHDASVQRIAFIAEREGLVCGYIVSSAVAGESELESVAVPPQFRRQGIAKMLCNAAMQWASNTGAQEIWLEVRAASEGAQALYRSLGFEATGTRKNYYVNPSDNALLMKAKLL